jgi:folate-binding protein YgfZ
LPTGQHDTVNSDFGLISSFPRAVAGHNRYLIVSSPQQAQLLLAALPPGITKQTPQLWKALDIISATPALTPSCQGQHLPQMLNLHLIEGISYSKGCYIGQETVARLHYRGQNKRAMFVLSTPSQLDVKPGDNVERQVESGWRNAGTVISCQVLAQHSVLLAILPIDSKTDGQFRLKDSDETLTLTIADYFDGA